MATVAHVTNTVEKCLVLGNINFSASTPVAGVASCGQNNSSKNCVAAMGSIATTSTSAGRVLSVSTRLGVNNYALDTMTVKGATVSGGTTTNYNGANATIQQLKSKAFYQNTMGWDMENVWTIDDGNDFPKLKGFK
jgi:hypothetical protein